MCQFLLINFGFYWQLLGICNVATSTYFGISWIWLRGRCIKKSKKKLTSVSFAFTHTYTLEKLTLLLFFPKRTWKILKNVQKRATWAHWEGVGVLTAPCDQDTTP